MKRSKKKQKRLEARIRAWEKLPDNARNSGAYRKPGSYNK